MVSSNCTYSFLYVKSNISGAFPLADFIVVQIVYVHRSDHPARASKVQLKQVGPHDLLFFRNDINVTVYKSHYELLARTVTASAPPSPGGRAANDDFLMPNQPKE